MPRHVSRQRLLATEHRHHRLARSRQRAYLRTVGPVRDRPTIGALGQRQIHANSMNAKTVNFKLSLKMRLSSEPLRSPLVQFVSRGYPNEGRLQRAHQDPVCGDEEGRPSWVDDEPAGRPMIEAVGVSFPTNPVASNAELDLSKARCERPIP